MRIGVAIVSTLATDDTLWGFISNAIRHADTPGKWLALPFFTILAA